MNHTYRLVWNQEAQRYVPAPECAKGKGKSKTKALAPAAVILSTVLALPAWAQTSAPAPAANQLPTGGQVVSGTAHIHQSGSQMQIQQGSQKAIIDWTGFNIGKDAAVTFQQPDTSAIALNRVTAGDASHIHGQLNANGQVWLINPNGIVFGQGSQVDVGGLVASTMNITNADFNNGNYTFTRNGATGSITNQGELTAKDGGSIALLAPTVSNDGILRAQLGTVALAAGDKITLQAGANGLLNVEIDPATIRTLVENKQLIVADGGQVIMTGRAADALSSSVVSNTGTIQANRLQEKDGKILLIADMQHGETKAAGTLEAHFIDTSAATVSIDQDLHINTAGGQWLIDPVDITIDQNKATAIQNALGTGNVTISTADGANNGSLGTNGTGTDKGDIHVNADITYTQNKLTLNADNDINLNAAIYVNDSGTLALNYGGTQGNSSAPPAADSSINASFGTNGGFAGKVNFAQAGPGLLAINGHDYTVIKDVAALQAMSSNLAGKYVLGGDINASSVANFAPIGSSSTRFTGTFDGLGHTIGNLTINNSNKNYIGLFGVTQGATLRNIGLVAADIKGGSNVGALAGYQEGGSIHNAYATGQVSGIDYVGGLVGQQYNGSISNAYATGPVSGSNYVGGLVGYQWSGSTISNAYATGQVSGSNYVGGLVGLQDGSGSGSISISKAYATGSVRGSLAVGGLVGYQYGSIGNAYAAGLVSGSGFVGGLVGYQSSGSISNAYATGQVTGAGSYFGGLVGYQYSGSISSSYWNTETAGPATQGVGYRLQTGVTGKTTAQLADVSALGWDGDIWGTETLIESAQAAGYRKAGTSLVFLKGLTRDQDKTSTNGTLFNGGYGTATAAWTLTSWQQLQNINHNSTTLGGHYQLETNLDKNSAGYVSLASETANGGKGWRPIGDFGGRFKGDFDGQNHTIGDLHIRRSGQNYVGLFGMAQDATLRNIGLVAANIEGGGYVGGLVGSQYIGGSISNVYATGSVTGTGNDVGGLVGSQDGSISNAYATGSVSGSGSVGGLVGSQNGSISNAYATGSVSGTTRVGGLVGNQYRSIYNAYATGQVSGSDYVGGLVGTQQTDSISNAYATGLVTGTGHYVGGLVGTQYGSIYNAYATGPVSGTTRVGGLVGEQAGSIGNAYATGPVSGSNYVGGLVGSKWSSSISSSYWNTETAGQATQGVGSGPQTGVTGKTTEQLKQLATFTGWDIADAGGTGTVWRIYEGHTGPLLRSFLKQATVTADTSGITDKTYDGTAASGSVTYTTSTPGATLDGTLGYTTNSKNAGSYSTADGSLKFTGLYSDQQGYDISYVSNPATLTIGKAALTVTGMTANNKTYDGGTVATLSGGILSGVISSEAVTLGSSTGTFADKNVGTGKAVTASGITLDGTDAANYTVTQPTGLTADISAKALTVTGMTANNKTYDGDTVATLSGGSLDGVIGSEAVTLGSSTGTFADKNVGTGKAVTASGITLDGADAGNYTVTQPTGLTADISAKALTVTGMTANNKTYDGGTVATLSGGSLDGVIGSEIVTFSGQTGTFADKNVGTGKTVSASGITLDGADAANYTVIQPTGLTADIDRAALQITANDASKTQGDALVLNGSTGFTVGAGLVTGEMVDSVQLGSPGTPASAAVGSYVITASNAAGSSGFDADNYAITYTDGTLTVTASPVTPPPVVPPVEPPTPLPPAGSLPSGGAIWLAQNQREDADAASANRFGWGAMPAAQLQAGGAGSVPYLALAPDFIRMQDEE